MGTLEEMLEGLQDCGERLAWQHGNNLHNDDALKYALRIRKLQNELGIGITEFPDISIMAWMQRMLTRWPTD